MLFYDSTELLFVFIYVLWLLVDVLLRKYSTTDIHIFPVHLLLFYSISLFNYLLNLRSRLRGWHLKLWSPGSAIPLPGWRYYLSVRSRSEVFKVNHLKLSSCHRLTHRNLYTDEKVTSSSARSRTTSVTQWHLAEETRLYNPACITNFQVFTKRPEM